MVKEESFKQYSLVSFGNKESNQDIPAEVAKDKQDTFEIKAEELQVEVPEQVADKGYWSDDDIRVKLKVQRKVVLRTSVA